MGFSTWFNGRKTRRGGHDPVKNRGKGVGDRWDNRLDRRRLTGQPLNRRHPFVYDAARNEEVEMLELGIDVEGKAVARDPPRDSHPDSRQFVVADPHAGEPRQPVRRNPEGSYGLDQHRFQVANVAMDVTSIGPKIEDRVPDQLAGPVIGDVASPARFNYLNALSFERVRRRDDVSAIVTSLHAQRDDRRMFEEKELIRDGI